MGRKIRANTIEAASCHNLVSIDCKTVDFFLKISKEIGKAWLKSLTRAKRASLSPQSRSLFSALFETFCLTARAYLNTQKYGLFCSLAFPWLWREKHPGNEVVYGVYILFNDILQLQFFSTFSSLLFHQELLIPPSAKDTMSEWTKNEWMNELKIYDDAF